MEYRGLTLDPFQERAIKALERGRSVLVCAPTGTGKTIIADWIVEKALQTGKQVIYTAPIKALSNQKYRDYCRLHGEERVGLVTGDLVIRRDAPCVVMTTEILRNMLLAGEKVENLLAVVVDEIHFLDDRERGTVWEEVLIYLPTEVAVVGLSATLSNQQEFSAWLGHVRGTEVEVVRENQRAVPLHFLQMSVDTGLVDGPTYDQIYKRKKPRRTNKQRGRRGRRGSAPSGRGRSRKTGHVDVFHALNDADLLPYLFFVFSRRDTELLARALSRAISISLLDDEEKTRSDARLAQAAEEIPDALDPELEAMYRKGVAFHHAGLHVQLKALVEELYEARLIKVLYCTSTFALGINMPARTVVFDGLKKFDGRRVGPLTTRQFMQKAGRAGRRGMDEVGHVVLRVDFDEYSEFKPLMERYMEGTPEPVHSSFNLSFNSVVLLLDQHERARIREILDKSFLAWHLQRRAQAHSERADVLRSVDNKRADKQAKKLSARADRALTRVYDAFEEKVHFLTSIGYLDAEGGFNAGARVLQHVQISEIFVTELVLSGALEDLPPTRLFGVLCGVTNELPRHARAGFSPAQEDRELHRRIRRVRNSQAVLGAEAITGIEVDWDPDVLHLGRMWAEGHALVEIVDLIDSATDLSGDLITGFRRAKDLAGQLLDVYAELPDRVAMLRQLVRTVSRDEVQVVG